MTVCLCSHGVKHHLRRALTSLSQQNFDGHFRVVVIGPCKKDDFQDFSNLFSLEFLVTKEKNISWVRNQGLEKLASDELVYFLDEDCSLSRPDHLKRLYNSFLEKQWDILGSSYECRGEGFFAKAYNVLCNMWFDMGRSFETPHLLGGNLAVGKNVKKNSVQFSQAYQFGGEEIDFAVQAHLKGLRIVTSSDFSVEHHCSHDGRKFSLRSWQQRKGIIKQELSFLEKAKFFLRYQADLKFKIAVFLYLFLQRGARVLRL